MASQPKAIIVPAAWKWSTNAQPKNHGSALNRNILYWIPTIVHWAGLKTVSPAPKARTIAALALTKCMAVMWSMPITVPVCMPALKFAAPMPR